ncbi:YesL family protein [Oceanobacillus rekensis]|uniref:YesL family protein n=1 Tax=Oceanobacillus rekensis TaxID=937927 RepID=UPI0015931B81|nr:DUF624 domain-containing protein [Oceanobacillus rekensis]
MQDIGNKINNAGEWVYRLLILNFLWVGFTLVGFGILGIFPATHALFAVLRKFLMKKRSVKMTKDFIYYYRKDFCKSNALGYVIVLIAAILWIDFRYFMSITSFGMFVLAHFMLLFFVFSLLSLLILFPIFTHSELSFMQYVKNALIYPFTHLGTMILLAASLGLYYFIVNQVPGFIPFLGISFPCFVIMKIILPTFQKKERKVKGWFKGQNDTRIYY